jgi:ribA/ribD-fused uncharacterized protein
MLKNWKKYRPIEFELINGYVHNWFSNMTPCLIEIDGIQYNSVENYYQAMKSNNLDDWKRIVVLAPNKSKREGQKINMRYDWEFVKVDVMYKALSVKFTIPEWKEKLLSTNNDMIIEWNNWNDKIWGVSIKDNLGQNLLGLTLIKIRDEIRRN